MKRKFKKLTQYYSLFDECYRFVTIINVDLKKFTDVNWNAEREIVYRIVKDY